MLETVSKGTPQYAIAYLYETVSYCGVAIFGIITGFVSCSRTMKNEKRLGRFLGLWLEVVFYSLLLTISISLMTAQPVDARRIIECFFPIAGQTYWYFSTYFILFLIIPYLNKTVLENTALQNTTLLCFAAIMLYYSHTLTGLFAISMLTFFYIIGALIRKYNIQYVISKGKCAMCYFTLLILTYLWTVVVKPTNSALGGILLRYDSPTVIGMAFCMVVFFAKMNSVPKVLDGLSSLGESAFAIYLINDNPLFRACFIENKIAAVSDKTFRLLFLIPVVSVLFSIVCILFDRIRIKLFNWLHVSVIQDRLYELWNQFTQLMCKYFCLLIMKNKES